MLVVFKDYLGVTRNNIYFIKIQTLNWLLFLSYASQVLFISLLSLFRFDYPHWLYTNATVCVKRSYFGDIRSQTLHLLTIVPLMCGLFSINTIIKNTHKFIEHFV